MNEARTGEEVYEGMQIPERDNIQTDPVPEDPDDFELSLGESLESVLDITRWTSGQDLPALYEDLQDRVSHATADEDRDLRRIREVVFPNVGTGWPSWMNFSTRAWKYLSSFPHFLPYLPNLYGHE